MLFGFISSSMQWGPPQIIPFGIADTLYNTTSIIISAIYAIVGSFLIVKLRSNSTKWRLSVIILYLGLCLCMKDWFFEYGFFFLDILLGPALFLAEVECAFKLLKKYRSEID